jgi:hypothetical protein
MTDERACEDVPQHGRGYADDTDACAHVQEQHALDQPELCRFVRVAQV